MIAIMPPLLAVAVAAFLSLKGGLVVTIPIGGRVLGSTTVNRAGFRTRTLVTRRSVRWDDVTALEVYSIPGRGASGGYVLQAHREGRHPLDLPGVFATPSQVDGPEFTAKVEEIQAAWRAATGQEPVPSSGD